MRKYFLRVNCHCQLTDSLGSGGQKGTIVCSCVYLLLKFFLFLWHQCLVYYCNNCASDNDKKNWNFVYHTVEFACKVLCCILLSRFFKVLYWISFKFRITQVVWMRWRYTQMRARQYFASSTSLLFCWCK